uniref:Uncharacterized protein n=1 Tax=Candidozyma auris TaxID=498019 RepID=A0A0L0NR76_CANAR
MFKTAFLKIFFIFPEADVTVFEPPLFLASATHKILRRIIAKWVRNA